MHESQAHSVTLGVKMFSILTALYLLCCMIMLGIMIIDSSNRTETFHCPRLIKSYSKKYTPQKHLYLTFMLAALGPITLGSFLASVFTDIQEEIYLSTHPEAEELWKIGEAMKEE